MLYNRAVDGTTKVGVLVSNDPSLITYAIKYILHRTSHIAVSCGIERSDTCLQATLSEKLISCPEGHLYYRSKLGIFACNVILNVCKTFKVGYELFHDSFPSDETLDEDVGWFEVLWSHVFLDEGLRTGDCTSMFRCTRDRCRTRYRRCFVVAHRS